MSGISKALVRLSVSIIPASSDDVLKRIRPASGRLSRRAEDALALAMIWGSLVIVGLVAMLGLAVGGHQIGAVPEQIGFVVGLGLAWFSFTGLCIHVGRFLVAALAVRSIERSYLRSNNRS
jgi:hypothetical protein